MSSFRFPLLANQKNQWPIGLAVGIYATITYGIAGFLAQKGSPTILPFTALDRAIPFAPWTFWIYSSVSFIFLTSCAVQRELPLYNRFLWSYLLAYTVFPILFVLFPSTFPRDQFPLPADASAVTRASFEFFRAHMDNATNCFPSMHVASCVMSTAPLYKRRPRMFLVYLAWSIAIVITTLTTKQHYAIDLIPGALAGYGSYFVTTRLFKYRDELSWDDVK